MRIVPVVIEYPDGPKVTFQHRIAAARMTADVMRTFTRITKKQPRWDPNVQFWKSPEPMDPVMKATAVRGSSDGWWDTWVEARRRGVDIDKTVLLLWHGMERDSSGIGQPTGLHQWNEDADPNVGGIATNGLGQLSQAIRYGFRGPVYRAQVLYAVHELGHALGRSHIVGPYGEDPYYESWTSVMGYSYSAFANGGKVNGNIPNPLLARPEEIVTWRAHSVFEEIPERWTATSAGFADDIVFAKKQEIQDIFEATNNSELRARLIVGTLQQEQADG